MINPQEHHRIIRYLKSPVIDLGGGSLVSEKAVKMDQPLLSLVRQGGAKTICVDGIRDDSAFLPLWDLIAEGGCLISANELSEGIMRLCRRNARFQTLETYPFMVLKKLNGPAGEVPFERKSPEEGQKKICLVRYGAYGDHIQMSMVIDHYYREGWWIAYNTNRKGREIFKGDPRIHEYIDHEDNIIPANRELLQAYWDELAKGFDKFVNFAEIAERTLLRAEGQPEFCDPWEKRHAECNRNYFDEHFVRCGLPEIKGRVPVIWLSSKEKDFAQGEVEKARQKTGKSFIVLWNIMGSSFHKMYPWMYDVWYLCQNNGDDIGFITVSDQLGAFLEERRFTNLFPRAGKYTLRNTLALHSAVDAVVTTETNSMNAAFGFPAPMIALLSHSSKDQFPWRERDIPMHPSAKDCPCYPCHQLHYSRLSCPRGTINQDATRCMDYIAPGDVYKNLLRIRNGNYADAVASPL